jgi:hypothetical protein
LITRTDLVADRAAVASSDEQYGVASVPFPGLDVEHEALFCR